MKKSIKLFISIFALLLVCVGTIALGGCKDKTNNMAYGQEFTVLESSVKTCQRVSYASVYVAMKLNVTVRNTTNNDYNFNPAAFMLYWNDSDLVAGADDSLSFSFGTGENILIQTNSIQNFNLSDYSMRFHYDYNNFSNTTTHQNELKNKLKNVDFTLKYNGITVAKFNMDVSNIEFIEG